MHDLFEANGYATIPAVLSADECAEIAARVTPAATGSGGSRALLREEWCGELAARLRSSLLLAPLAPEAQRVVQCTYFEKSRDRNWIVPIHQDLSVPVAERVEHPDLSGWSVKEGALFVQAPAALLERMVAFRCHLDDCSLEDGPLRVVPGSHRFGRLESGQEASLRESHGEVSCLVARGGVLALRPLLLHASSKASGQSRRRVLHFLFGPPDPPHGLAWQG